MSQALETTFPQGVDSLEALETAGDNITRQMRLAGLDFHLGVALRPFPAEALAEARDHTRGPRGELESSLRATQ